MTLFPSTYWNKIENKFLLGSGSSYTLGSTGGSADAVCVAHDHRVIYKEGTTTAYTKGVQQCGAEGTVYPILSWSSNINQNNLFAQSVGESATGKNMPPYLVVNIWVRVNQSDYISN